MRIVIEIDGIEVTAKVASEAKDTASSQLSASPQPSSPSSRLPAAGAQDAGAAPAIPGQISGAPQPFMLPGLVSQIVGPSDVAAGAAPQTQSAAAEPVAEAAEGNDQAAGAAPGHQE